jgi:hypothetical protein
MTAIGNYTGFFVSELLLSNINYIQNCAKIINNMYLLRSKRAENL